MNFGLSLKILAVTLVTGTVLACGPAIAQQIQIPTLQVCNLSHLDAYAFVNIESRGKFSLRGKLICEPKNSGKISGALDIVDLSMNDSTIQGSIKFTTFDQVTSGGKETPTLWVNGQCDAKGVNGCRYWLMVVDNVKKGKTFQKTFDIVSFLVLDGNGQRVAYGTGSVVDGDLEVAYNGN